MIKGQNCAILRVEDIEQAEVFCKKWYLINFNHLFSCRHDFSFTERKKLKAHVHPLSAPKRLDPWHSHHIIFKQQYEEIPQPANLSSKINSILPALSPDNQTTPNPITHSNEEKLVSTPKQQSVQQVAPHPKLNMFSNQIAPPFSTQKDVSRLTKTSEVSPKKGEE